MHREEWVLHKAWQYAEAGRWTLTPVSTELLKDLNNAADRNDARSSENNSFLTWSKSNLRPIFYYNCSRFNNYASLDVFTYVDLPIFFFFFFSILLSNHLPIICRELFEYWKEWSKRKTFGKEIKTDLSFNKLRFVVYNLNVRVERWTKGNVLGLGISTDPFLADRYYRLISYPMHNAIIEYVNWF